MTIFSSPALKGGALALLAAALFGLSTPLVQYFGLGLGAFTTAALLYAGAAAVALLMRHPPEREAALRRSDWPRVMAMAGLGAVIGPVALAWGLQRTSGSSSLSDLGIVGCKSTAAGYFSPLSYPISRYWAAKSSKTILAGADFRFRRPKPDRLLAPR